VKGNYDGQRYVAAFAIAEMVNHTQDDTALLDQIVTQLLTALVDPKLTVAALRGLGNIVSSTAEQINTYASSILDALMASVDSQKDFVALEAMTSLVKVFQVVDETRIAPVLINVCHRIRPAFDHGNELIRSASATLFGSLSRFGAAGSKLQGTFGEQIHSNLACIVVHVNDESPKVQTAFKRTLFQVGPLLGNEQLKTILNTPHIFSPDMDIDYQEFLFMHLSKALIAGFPERLNSYVQTCLDPYFQSHWDVIKANAASFVGTILGHMPEEVRKSSGINPGLISKALVELLSSPSAIVRAKVAESLSLLHSY